MSTAAASELWVWMNGEPVGRWQRTRSGGHRFVYEAAWLASPRARPLSLSLPITPDRTVAGPAVAQFFDNLLPDDERIGRRVSARFQVGSTEVFALLQAIGRDCGGCGAAAAARSAAHRLRARGLHAHGRSRSGPPPAWRGRRTRAG